MKEKESHDQDIFKQQSLFDSAHEDTNVPLGIF